METIGDRLQKGLDAHSDLGDVRAVYRALSAGETGYRTTYSTVARYFSGDVKEPPLDFLKAAAPVLSVSPAWLAFGDGPMRPVDSGGPFSELGEEADVPSSPMAELMGGAAGRAALKDLVARVADAAPTHGPAPTSAQIQSLSVNLTFSFQSMWGAIGPKEGTSLAELRIFFLVWVAALLTGVAGPGQGRPLSEVLAALPYLPTPETGVGDAS